MTAPSQTPEAAGLEVVAWRVHDWADGWIYFESEYWAGRECKDDDREPQPLVTAASAQAAIDAEKAKVAELERHVQVALNEKAAVVAEYVKSVERLTDRATAAEARADRMADSNEGLIEDLYQAVLVAYGRGACEWAWLNYPQWRDALAAGQEVAPIARAALQQETQL